MRKVPYEIRAMQSTFEDMKDTLCRVIGFLSKWGLNQSEILTEAYEAFHYAYHKYDPNKSDDFEKYTVQVVWRLTKSQVRDRLRKQWKLDRLKIPKADFCRIPSPEPDYTEFPEPEGEDAKKVIDLILNPPPPLRELYEKYSHYGQKSTRLAWRKALTRYLRTRHWSRNPWSESRVHEAFRAISQTLKESCNAEVV